MDKVAPELIAILQYLLPGFLAAWVFYGFTSFPKPSEFERVIQALIFTFIVQFVVAIEETALIWVGQWISLGHWSQTSHWHFFGLAPIRHLSDSRAGPLGGFK